MTYLGLPIAIAGIVAMAVVGNQDGRFQTDEKLVLFLTLAGIVLCYCADLYRWRKR